MRRTSTLVMGATLLAAASGCMTVTHKTVVESPNKATLAAGVLGDLFIGYGIYKGTGLDEGVTSYGDSTGADLAGALTWGVLTAIFIDVPLLFYLVD
jgi:ABC-type Na+ transport system ATPase subunit NatA